MQGLDPMNPQPALPSGLLHRWLGVTRDRPAHLIAAAGWSADDPAGDYCPRCAVTITPEEWSTEGCLRCRSRRPPWTLRARTGPTPAIRVVRLGSYQGALREWIHEFKFARWEAMGWELGRRLGEAARSGAAEYDVLVPVPTAWARQLRRGQDHTAILGRAASRACGLPMRRALRRRNGLPQTAVAASARRDNVRGRFAMRRWRRVEGLRVLLVDDVMTTGSTLIEASRTLLEGGAAAVGIAVLAVADGGRRAAVRVEESALNAD